jgi:uncharacterized membrane protein (UPF0127 family)
MIHGMREPIVAVQKEGGVVVCDRCFLADRPLTRLRGLLGRKSLSADEGLLLSPANGIHTWFMRFPIDVVFLAADLTVLGVREGVRPWRMRAWRRSRAVLELPEGAAARHGLRPGDRLSLAETGDEHAKVLLLVDDGEDGRLIVNGHGSLSAAARTADAIGDLNLPIGVVVLADDQESAESAA